MSSIWVYPGQGAQTAHMLHVLPQTTLVKQYLDHASEVLQEDVLALDHPVALQSTRAVQLCLLISGVISSAILSEHQVKPDYVAGLSIGAWAAAVVADVLKFEDALKLVSLRGHLMQNAYPSGYGMTAIIGADKASVEGWVKQVFAIRSEIYIANINAHNQIVISGHHDAMQQVSDLARQHGAMGKRLAISVPSHCALLAPQAQQLSQHLEGIVLQPPKIRYLSGTTARLLTQAEQIGHDLAFNMSRTIDWESTAQVAWERGVRLQIEAFPGVVLTGLTRRIFKEGIVLPFQGTRLDSLVSAMQKERQASN